MKITAQDIKSLISKANLEGNVSMSFSGIQTLAEATISEIAWIKPSLPGAAEMINTTIAGGVICDQNTFNFFKGDVNSKLFIVTPDPKAAYVACVNFVNDSLNPKKAASIHPTAIIDPACVLGKNVSIGAYSIIGACTLGDNTVIHEHVKIHDRVTIGSNCLVREFCSIGGAGFGYLKNSKNENEHIPHIGSVVIENNVEIFPYTNVDRGTLGPTLIKEGTVIDHYVHIGHNTTTGKNNIITACTVLAGGSVIKDNCFIGVNTLVREKCVIGSNVITGMGSVVVKDIPDSEVWIGNPARFLKANK